MIHFSLFLKFTYFDRVGQHFYLKTNKTFFTCFMALKSVVFSCYLFMVALGLP